MMPVEMTVEECLDLLRTNIVGRVAMSTPVGPRIVPVNYAMYGDEMIVFRTTPYSELGTYGWNAELAFEIDHIDYDRHQGWSVADIRRNWDPRPWADGQRNLYMKLVWHDVTGRRLGTGWTTGNLAPVRRAL